MGASESKLQFRKQIFALLEDKQSDEFWSSFYQLPDTAEDIFNLCAHNEVRKGLESNPAVWEELIKRLVNRIQVFIENEQPPTTQDIKEILNCVRFLTRILPFVFELENDFEKTVFWDTNLGSRLVTQITQLLFYRGFTIQSSQSSPNIRYVIWSQGIGASSAPPSTREEIQRRTEVMRLLQCILGATVYQTTGTAEARQNIWANELVSKQEKKAVLGMLCSFLNTVANYDPIGWAKLPYNHFLIGDVNEPLVSLCCQCIVAILDFQSELEVQFSAENQMRTTESNDSLNSRFAASSQTQSSSNQSSTNLFNYYFAKLHKNEDLNFLIKGFTRLLLNPIEAAQTFLPGSSKSVDMTAELLLLIWASVNQNKKFYNALCTSPTVLIVVRAIINESLDARNNSSKLGSLRLSCFLLQKLSQAREFSIQLNQSVDISILGSNSKLFPKYSHGCWGDIIYLLVFILLATPTSSRAAILHLQESYLSTLANLAPMITKFSDATANRLLSLFMVYSSPKYLLAQERNHVRLFYLLYVIDCILQYQYSGNAQIVYTFVRNKEKVLALRDMTFESALDVISNAKKNTAEKQEDLGTPVDSPETSSSSTSPSRKSISEKLKGKMPLDSQSIKSTSGFEATSSWFNEWKNRLPIQVLTTLVLHLSPQIEEYCLENDVIDDSKVLAYLSKKTMVGVLPQPHPIITHNFIYSEHMHSWITAYMWGAWYMKSLDQLDAETAKRCPSIWAGTRVKLFGVSTQ